MWNPPWLKAVTPGLLLLACSAGAATAQAGGDFDAYAGGGLGLWNAGNSVNADGSDYEIAGALAYTDDSGWGGQLDVAFFKQQFASLSIPDRDSAVLAGHVYHRTPQWLLGGMLQRREYYRDYAAANVNENFMGLEGQWYFDRITLQGQYGHEEFALGNGLPDYDGDFATLRVSYFVEDNLRVDGGLGLVRDSYPGYDYEQTNLELGVEYRLSASPISVFAEYTHIYETDVGWKVDADLTLFGVRYNFGKNTLRERSRSGAGLASAPRVILW